MLQVKEEINEIIDTLPDEVLDDLLIYLKKIQVSSKDKIKLSLNLGTILEEDRVVLEKLAK